MSGRAKPVREFISNGVNLKIWLVMSVIILGIIDIAIAVERYVPSQYSTIQSAIDASLPGDTVIVSDGSYARASILGARNITVRSQNGPQHCIINGDGQYGFYLYGTGNGTCLLKGFTLINCPFDYGAIYCKEGSSPIIANCIIVNNGDPDGPAHYRGIAGIRCYKFSSPIISNCIIVNNYFCAGIDDFGAGIFCQNHCNPTVINCTIVGNISRNKGGGIYCQDNCDIKVSNCILWSNSPAEITLETGSSASVSYSDIQGGWLGESNIDANPYFVNPSYWNPNMLRTIGDYHLRQDSPCINAGTNTPPGGLSETDIDGESRIKFGRVDMGADEWSGPWMIYVDSDANGLNNGSSWSDAYKFLQDALADANSAAKPVEIRVAQGIYKPDKDTLHPNGTDDRTASFQLINGVTIKGGYAGFGEANHDAHDIALYETILSGDLNGNDIQGLQPSELLEHPSRAENSYHIFYHPLGLNLDENAILDGCCITGGNASSWPHDDGGGMYNNHSSPTLINCTLIGNSAGGLGGGMYNYESSPKVTFCTFSANYGYNGGGIYNIRSMSKIISCVFTTNSAGTEGGGIYNFESSPTVEDCAFIDNSVDWRGGGIYNTYYSSPIIKSCIFSGNSAAYYWGGGIDSDFSNITTVEGCVFTANSASRGGGIRNSSSSLIITDSAFISNSATVRGGGIDTNGGSMTLKGCMFIDNSAKVGGGMYNELTIMTSRNCTIIKNSATDDGGGIYNYRGISTIEGCTITDNLATDWGGGMYNGSYSKTTVVSCTFSNNTARDGGGICNYDSSPILENCTFSGNSATQQGGGMFNYSTCSPSITNCVFWDDVPSEIYDGTPTVTYSDVQGSYSGTGNINADPCFVNPDSNDFHLLPASPCINAGDPNFIAGPNETDMDGEQRVMLDRVDMGSDEFNPFKAEFVVARKERIDRTIFEYECQVTLTNLSRFAIENAQLEMLKVSENIIIVDPNVSFGPIEVSGSVTSSDMCTFRVDRSKAIDPAKIFWRSTCELEDSGQIIQYTLSSIINLEPEDTADDSKVDLAGLVEKWLWTGNAGSIKEDITGDGIVNLADFAVLARQKFEGKENEK